MISKDSSSPGQDSFSWRASIPGAKARLIHAQEWMIFTELFLWHLRASQEQCGREKLCCFLWERSPGSSLAGNFARSGIANEMMSKETSTDLKLLQPLQLRVHLHLTRQQSSRQRLDVMPVWSLSLQRALNKIKSKSTQHSQSLAPHCCPEWWGEKQNQQNIPDKFLSRLWNLTFQL